MATTFTGSPNGTALLEAVRLGQGVAQQGNPMQALVQGIARARKGPERDQKKRCRRQARQHYACDCQGRCNASDQDQQPARNHVDDISAR
jgi:predicted SprT family Zn-dependent metalloprotease